MNFILNYLNLNNVLNTGFFKCIDIKEKDVQENYQITIKVLEDELNSISKKKRSIIFLFKTATE